MNIVKKNYELRVLCGAGVFHQNYSVGVVKNEQFHLQITTTTVSESKWCPVHHRSKQNLKQCDFLKGALDPNIRT